MLSSAHDEVDAAGLLGERDKPWELELRGRRLIVERCLWDVGEAGVPAVEVVGEVVVEYPGADLEE